LATVQVRLDLMDEHRSAPALLDRLADVPLALGGVFDRVENANIVAPGNLCNNLLHK